MGIGRNPNSIPGNARRATCPATPPTSPANRSAESLSQFQFIALEPETHVHAQIYAENVRLLSHSSDC